MADLLLGDDEADAGSRCPGGRTSSLRPPFVDQVIVENLRAGVLDVSGRGHQRDTTSRGDVEQAGDGV
jgi:hypothetical protein